MAHSTLSVLRKAGQLLHFQYDVENEVSETGKRLESFLQQALDEVLHETDWLPAMMVVSTLAPSNDHNDYSFSYSFVLPNDCSRLVDLFPYTGDNAGYPDPNSYPYGFLGYGHLFAGLNPLRSNVRRIQNRILLNIDKITAIYITNNFDYILENNAPDVKWFFDLIAHRLAVIVGATMSNNNDYQQLKQEYSTNLASCINKNCNLKDSVYNYANAGIYPYSSGGNMSY